MTYDTRTRRTQRIQKARVFGISGTLAIVVIGVATFFSMHVYWVGELPAKLALRVTGGRSEYSEPPATHTQDWKGRKDLAAAFSPTLLTGNRVRFTSHLPATERQSLIDKQMRRDKFRHVKTLEALPLALLTEQADRVGRTFLRKQVLALLPGETIEFSAEAFSTAAPDLVFRCLGATADRLDLPGRLAFHHSVAGDGVVPISPRGEPVVYRPPQLSPTSPLQLTWDKDAPGVLVIAGEFKPRKPHSGVLMVSLDKAEHGLEALSGTLRQLKAQGFRLDTFKPVWPATKDAHADMQVLLSEPLSPQGANLTARLGELGFSSLRMNFAQQAPRHDDWSGFGAEIDVIRQREGRLALRQALARLSAEDLTGNLLSVNVEIPTPAFGLTWRSALRAETSLASWLYAAWLGKALAPRMAYERQVEEKSLQVDESLASFLASPAAKGIGAVVLTAHEAHARDKNPDAHPVIPGEVVLATRDPAAQASPLLQSARDIPAAVLSLLEPGIRTLPSSLALIELPNTDVLVSEHGWLSLPTNPEARAATSRVAIPERVGFLAEVRKERERRGRRYLNVTVPAESSHQGVAFAFRGLPHDIACHTEPVLSGFEARFVEDGSFAISGPAGAPAFTVRCSWHLPSTMPNEISFSAQRGGLPVPATELAFGPFSLSGTLFTTTEGNLNLTVNGEFAPAMVPPAPDAKSHIHAWLADFSSGIGALP